MIALFEPNAGILIDVWEAIQREIAQLIKKELKTNPDFRLFSATNIELDSVQQFLDTQESPSDRERAAYFLMTTIRDLDISRSTHQGTPEIPFRHIYFVEGIRRGQNDFRIYVVLLGTGTMEAVAHAAADKIRRIMESQDVGVVHEIAFAPMEVCEIYNDAATEVYLRHVRSLVAADLKPHHIVAEHLSQDYAYEFSCHRDG